MNLSLGFWTSLKSEAQLIPFTDKEKWTKKVTWAIYRQDKKKLKKVLKSWNWTLHKDSTKIPQIYTLPQFLSMLEKNCGTYWLDSYNLLTSKNDLKSSKQLKIIFPFMSVRITLLYKQCLCILTLPECNT